MTGRPNECVYDEEYIRGLPDFVKGSPNSWPVTILRSGRPDMAAAREQIEAWHSELPLDRRPRFRSQLRSGELAAFESAIAELYVHHWLAGMRDVARIDVEPWEGLGQGNPDFVVGLADERTLVCEVYSRASVFTKMEELETLFKRQCAKYIPGAQVAIMGPELPASEHGVRALVRAIRTERETGTLKDNESTYVKYLGGRANVLVSTVALAGGFVVTGWARTWSTAGILPRLAEGVEKKLRRLKKHAGQPIVLFVTDQTDAHLDEEDWFTLCYGELRWQVSAGPDGSARLASQPLPVQGGLFTRSQHGRPRLPYVSALIAGKPVWDDRGYGLRFVGFANPYAEASVPSVITDSLPFYLVNPSAAGHLHRVPPGPMRP